MNAFQDIRRRGFDGFQTVQELRDTSLAAVPEEAGVYLFLRPQPDEPVFLPTSPAGRPKDRDPSVSIEMLRASWVPDARILYIGKAGGTGMKSTLRSRLRAYLRHGAGHRAAHWGGRLIWQLADSDQLLVAWKPTPGVEPRQVEQEMIREFEQRYGQRPFANRTG